jgi:hypothetical protein
MSHPCQLHADFVRASLNSGVSIDEKSVVLPSVLSFGRHHRFSP